MVLTITVCFWKINDFNEGNCKNCEFIYTPVFNNPSYKYSSSGFFKTEINMTYPMMFAPSTFDKLLKNVFIH